MIEDPHHKGLRARQMEGMERALSDIQRRLKEMKSTVRRARHEVDMIPHGDPLKPIQALAKLHGEIGPLIVRTIACGIADPDSMDRKTDRKTDREKPEG